MEITFTVYGDPKALKRHRTFRKGNIVGSYDPSRVDKADFLAQAIEHKPPKPLDEPVSLSVAAFFARPKSHYRTGKFKGALRKDIPEYHTKRPDFDNILKLIADALNGVFWKDDSVIVWVQMVKLYSDCPRVEVTISTE